MLLHAAAHFVAIFVKSGEERAAPAGALLSVGRHHRSIQIATEPLRPTVLARLVTFAAVLSVVAVSAPALAPGLLSAVLHRGAASGPSASAMQQLPAAPDLRDRGASRQVALSANGAGHFMARAAINGRQVEVMIDTGATMVALTDVTARRLGLHPPMSAYRDALSTANGVVMAARVTLDEIRLGSVTLHDVSAVVVPGTALPVDLLGMSFLSRLSKFEIAGGQLVLSQ